MNSIRKAWHATWHTELLHPAEKWAFGIFVFPTLALLMLLGLDNDEED